MAPDRCPDTISEDQGGQGRFHPLGESGSVGNATAQNDHVRINQIDHMGQAAGQAGRVAVLCLAGRSIVRGQKLGRVPGFAGPDPVVLCQARSGPPMMPTASRFPRHATAPGPVTKPYLVSSWVRAWAAGW